MKPADTVHESRTHPTITIRCICGKPYEVIRRGPHVCADCKHEWIMRPEERKK